MNATCNTLLESVAECLANGSCVEEFIPHARKLLNASGKGKASRHKPGVSLYRLTKHHRKIPEKIDEVWFPSNDVASLGRANRQGCSVFYCSSDPDCVFRELGVTVGQIVVHAEWTTTSTMVLHEIGYAPSAFGRLLSPRPLPQHHKIFYESELNEDERYIRDFLSLAFTEPGSFSYTLTAAIAEELLSIDGFAGIMYPTVAKAARNDNLALLPQFVRQGLILKQASLLEIKSVEECGKIEGMQLATLADVGDDGVLTWRFPSSDKCEPSESITFHQNMTIFCQSSHTVMVGNSQYKVEPGYRIQHEANGVTVRDLYGELIQPTSYT